jgi:putative ABC transport system permease protein
MRSLHIWRLRLRALFRSAAVDRDLQDELQAHVDYLTEENVAQGLPPDAARDKALRDFGAVARLQEECRDARGINWLTNAVQDLKYGVRLLRRSRGFATTAVLTIALGIGASTAMFSIVYSVVLRPLPFGAPDRLVALWTARPEMALPRGLVGAANARDWRAQNTIFEDIALVRAIGNFNLVGQGEPERLQGALISSNLLSILRVSPILGRGFTEDEDEIGHNDVALLSHTLWRTRFAANPSIVGRTIMLNGGAMTVVGVMGPDFQYPSREFQIWRPLTINPEDYKTRANDSFLSVARLKDGVTMDQARAEMNLIAARLQRTYPATNTDVGVVVEPLLAGTVSSVRTPLMVLLAAVGAMLLIGCANLANLLLTRSLARGRELAVRSALGAGRARLIAQSITELVPMLVAGGLFGLVLARWIVDVLVPLMPADMPRVESIAIHLPVLFVSIALLVVIGVAVGIWPAVELARVRDSNVAELTRSITGVPRHARFRDVLVVTQIAMTLLLLVTATLLIRSFAAVKDINPGFSSERVLSLHLAIPRSKYGSDAGVAAYCRWILERVQRLPDVESAGMVNRLPLAGGTQIGWVEVEGADAGTISVASTDWRVVTPDYFRTLDIPIVSGRPFSNADDDKAPLVGIIDERLARAAWPDRRVIGRRFRAGYAGAPWITIIGVVGHIRHDSLETDMRPQVYWNYLQRGQDRMALVVKTRGEPAALAQSIAAVIRSVDPEQPVYDVRPLTAVIDRSLARRWLQTTLLAVFAGLALLLATIGVYGVIAYGVSQRLREFGIRLALGARRQDIVHMVVARGARMTLIGVGLGLIGAVIAARVIATLLFGVGAWDLISFAAAAIGLHGVAMIACYLPARKAARIDPTSALRTE